MRLTPAAASVAVTAMETGEPVYQLLVQVALSQVIPLDGAVGSACAVKVVGLPVLPAVSWAVALPVWLPAVLSKV